MTVLSTRLLLAASLCLAPLGWAAAQDQAQQQQQQRDEQHKRDHQEEHLQQRPQHNTQQPPPNQQAPQTHTAPQGQHVGGPGAAGPGSAPQFQRPAQNNAAPPAAQPVQRQSQNAAPSPPAGATASPAPPPSPSQFQRPPGSPQNLGGATTGAVPPQQRPQQFQQRSIQSGGAAGSTAQQAQPQAQPHQQQTTISRGNFQPGARSNTTVTFAQHHGGAAPTAFDHGRFYGHDFGHFTPHDRELWRRGGWHHEFHNGRFGWWYAVDGIWYFYDEPVYPYPTFIPEVVYIPEEEEGPPPVYVDAPPEPTPAPQYGQPPAYYYYYCPDTQTYYPYVGSCASPWQPVPATPQ